MAKIFSEHKASLAPGGAYTTGTSIKFKSMTDAETNMAYQNMLERPEKLLLSLATWLELGHGSTAGPEPSQGPQVQVCG